MGDYVECVQTNYEEIVFYRDVTQTGCTCHACAQGPEETRPKQSDSYGRANRLASRHQVLQMSVRARASEQAGKDRDSGMSRLTLTNTHTHTHKCACVAGWVGGCRRRA
jgi:hypothetical protein